jgi:ribosome-associated protein
METDRFEVRPSVTVEKETMTDSNDEQRDGRRPARASSRRGGPARKSTRAHRLAAAEEARKLALVVAGAALEKKALAVEILDVVGKVDYADFLVLMTGRSNRQVDALAQAIEEACAKKKTRPLSIEGTGAAAWVLIDFGDVVVHIFQEEARGLYDIEGLWLDAKRLPVPGQIPE